MAAPDARGQVKVGQDVLNTRIHPKTKKMLAQLGDVVHETTDTDNAEIWFAPGMFARPSKPEAGKTAPQSVSLCAGDHDIVIAMTDERGRELQATLDYGETGMYAAGPDGTAQARVLLKKNGTIAIFTKKGNTKDGVGIQIAVNADGSITIAGSEGNAILLGSDGSIKAFNSSGGFSVSSSGVVKVSGSTQLALSAGSVAIGGPAGLPIAIGPNVVTAITALQSQITTLQTEVTALKTELTIMAVAWAALGALSGPILGVMVAPIAAPVAAAEVAALASVISGAGAVAASTAAQSAASAIIPSVRTTSD
jgi:hypothetical protein